MHELEKEDQDMHELEKEDQDLVTRSSSCKTWSCYFMIIARLLQIATSVTTDEMHMHC